MIVFKFADAGVKDVMQVPSRHDDTWFTVRSDVDEQRNGSDTLRRMRNIIRQHWSCGVR
ncbi:hypothetical protein [Solilutibacter silvestris]|uniref:hypothetical protein n=1 Tax=Solilutibacter silvestris TaxID=1645665 RepID=UPI0013FE086F|nr:hypothetical protein [Lysobacter silvestris]